MMRCVGYLLLFFRLPSTMAVFLWALAADTLMERPVMALRPMPCPAVLVFAVRFLAMVLRSGLRYALPARLARTWVGDTDNGQPLRPPQGER